MKQLQNGGDDFIKLGPIRRVVGNILSPSMRVTAVILFPRLRLIPGVDSASTTMNSSSHSIKSSAVAFTYIHISTPSIEPVKNVKGTDETGEKSSPAVPTLKKISKMYIACSPHLYPPQ